MKVPAFVTRLRASKYANLYLALLFALSLFGQCLLFNVLGGFGVMVSSLWRNPSGFWSFYLPKMFVAVLLASLVFLFKRKYWTLYVSALLSLWTLANLVYLRNVGNVITGASFLLLGNLNGFQSSILFYLRAQDLLLLLPILLTGLAVYLFDNRRRGWVGLGVGLALCVGMSVVESWALTLMLAKVEEGPLTPARKQEVVQRWAASPYEVPRLVACRAGGLTPVFYAGNFTLFHFLLADLKEIKDIKLSKILFTEQDQMLANAFIQNTPPHPSQVSSPLILILVESLETWAVRPDIMPNLCRFINEHETLLRANSVTSQIKDGMSADGQLIVNTGLLPISSGAVCSLYPSNRFPSLSENYAPSTAMVLSGAMTTWNQTGMSEAYHIKDNYAFPECQQADSIVFAALDTTYQTHDYVLALTIGSHLPFTLCNDLSTLVFPADMPEYMAHYLQCLQYTDACWGEFLRKVDTDPHLANATICITGDHIIFDNEMRSRFVQYCQTSHSDFAPEQAYTACIIYSPKIEQKQILDEVVYQMDIYPTLRHLIGADEYYWKGFGVNLLDSTAVRPITAEDAYSLSDKIIRSNYFETLLNNEVQP